MAGIYIHIPFCRQKCIYCNFFSLATKKFRDEFQRALLKEIEFTRDYLADEPVETIYFGGGTPSLLPVRHLEEIIQRIRGVYPSPASPLKGRGEGFEITIELNPDDITPEYLDGLAMAGINRLSLGVQSFFDEDLRYLGRIHDAKQAEKALTQIRDAGYVNLSADLIYGIPTGGNHHWQENLRRVIDLKIPHLSAYALTVEERTPLAWMIPTPGPSPDCFSSLATGGEGRIQDPGSRIRKPVSDDQAAEQFEILMETMEQAGYIQYEISNFCLPGYESRHNSNYWKGVPYLGLGPSAHSYDGASRRWNPSHLTAYIHHMASGKSIFDEEHLIPSQQYNEYVMTSLRTVWGCDQQEIGRRFGAEYQDYFCRQAIRCLASGHLQETDGIYTLTRQGKFLADRITAELFYLE